MNTKFKTKNTLLPAIVQDSQTNKVLMLGYMNEESYKTTEKTKKVTFYSRSRQKLWTKGETSGNFLMLKEILWDCDQDAILIKAKPTGPVCHTGSETCFSEKNIDSGNFLQYLEKIIQQRKNAEPSTSYTAKLFSKGINKIAQKVGEEAVELVIEAKDNNDDLFLNEAADLFYHTIVLLAAKEKSLSDVIRVLEGRHK